MGAPRKAGRHQQLEGVQRVELRGQTEVARGGKDGTGGDGLQVVQPTRRMGPRLGAAPAKNNCPTDGCQTCKNPSDFSSWVRDKNVKLILLERGPSLPHFISEMKQHAIAASRCADSECAERVAKQKVRVDIAQMHRWFNHTADYWDKMKDFARRSSLERQFFTYDELCDRPQEIANDLFRFLRLEPWRVNTSQTRKAGGAVMRDSIENADEVASVLKGTVFEGQVDEEFASWRAKAAL